MTHPPPAQAPRPVPMEQPADPTLAEWWQRLVARMVDGFVLSLLVSPLYIAYFVWMFSAMSKSLDRSMTSGSPTPPVMPVPMAGIVAWSFGIAGAVAVVGFGYDWLCHARWGATLGKRIMKTKVVRADDRGPAGAGPAAKRALAYPLAGVVPFLGSIFGLIDLLWMFNEKTTRQCLHDKFAGTIVIRTDPPPPRPPYGPPPGYPQPGYAQPGYAQPGYPQPGPQPGPHSGPQPGYPPPGGVPR